MESAEAMDDEHWQFFDFDNILSEAMARQKEARLHKQNAGEKDTLTYWCAWVAHANAAACLLPAPAPSPPPYC